MGELATWYRRRRLAEGTGAAHELELYEEPSPWQPLNRPCYCRWNMLQRRLLGKPDPGGIIACACIGPIGFDIPGYPGDDERMRHFVQELSLDRVRTILAPVVDWYRAACDAYTCAPEEPGYDMDTIRAGLVERLAQLPADEVEDLIAELA